MKLIYNRMSKNAYFFLLSIAIFFLVGSAYFSYSNFRSYQYYDTWVNHTEKVKLKIQKLGTLVKDLKITSIKVLATENPTDIVVYNNQINLIELQKSELEKLLADNETQLKNFKKLSKHIQVYTYISDSLLVDRKINKLDQLIIQETLAQEAIINDSLQSTIKKMIEEETKLLQYRNKQKDESEFFTPASSLLSSLISVIIVVILFLKITGLLNESTQSNELIKSILDSSPNGILTLKSIRNNDNDITHFSIVSSNAQALKLLNIEAKDITNKSLSEISSPLLDQTLFEMYCDIVNNTSTINNHTFHMPLGSRTGIWIHLIAKKLNDGLVITFSDITEQKLQQREIDERTLELKKSNEELEQFAYVASHDLQEPLRKVRAFGDRLATKYSSVLDDTGKDYIQRMQNAAARMQTLIEDLLQYSRVSRKTKEFATIDLNKVLQEVIEDLDESIDEKKAIINAVPLPLIKGDFIQMKQLFQNILSNAIKFSNTEIPPLITINVTIDTSKNHLHSSFYQEYWKITISDNGIGFDKQYREKIFTIFQRLHGKQEYKGTGIGLAICSRIVESHYGSIVADSESGQGACFTIYLPKLTNDEPNNYING